MECICPLIGTEKECLFDGVLCTAKRKRQTQHGAPKELWDLEMELSNVACYAMGPLLNTQESLAERFVQIRDKVRGMIREYGYKGPF